MQDTVNLFLLADIRLCINECAAQKTETDTMVCVTGAWFFFFYYYVLVRACDITLALHKETVEACLFTKEEEKTWFSV